MDSTIGEVFNIGGLREIAILELAKLVISETNSNSKITFTDYRNAYAVGYEDMAKRIPNINKIKEFIGWEPLISLEKTINDVARSLG